MDSNRDNQAIFLYLTQNISDDIIQYYDHYIYDYTDIIYYERIDMKNKRHRYFISLFIKDREMRRLLKGGIFISTEIYKAIKQVLRFMKDMFRYHTREEIYHEMIIPFLQVVKTYREIGKNFESYLYVTYNYKIQRYLSNFVKDPIDYAERYEFYKIEEEIYLNLDLYSKEHISTDNDEFQIELSDIRFIRGDKAGIFSELSVIDRKILVYYYDEGIRDKEIALRLAMHPSSVQRRRKQLEDLYHKKVENGEIKCLRLVEN